MDAYDLECEEFRDEIIAAHEQVKALLVAIAEDQPTAMRKIGMIMNVSAGLFADSVVATGMTKDRTQRQELAMIQAQLFHDICDDPLTNLLKWAKGEDADGD